MVHKFHERNMEVIMEFYFVPGTSKNFIIDCLRFWTFEYGVDGFSLNGNVVTAGMIDDDPVLASVKIFIDNGEGVRNSRENRRTALYNGNFLAHVRQFIRGEQGFNGQIAWDLRDNSVKYPVINYLANHNTLTVMDSVSYNMKHNEDNGESNMDGTSLNYCYNYGFEGPTDREDVMYIRNKQIKNAFTILLLSQGIPLIYAGDEIGHSCKGNNNPYCQDNDISYVNYDDAVKNSGIYEFVKDMISFRKSHKVLHMPKELQLSDYMSLGGPDISYHGEEPWMMEYGEDACHFAVMYFGRYGDGPDNNIDNIYVAFNMSKDEKVFNVPKLTENTRWEILFSTDCKNGATYTQESSVLTVPGGSEAVMIERV